MKYVLTILGLMMVLVFGVLATVGQSSQAGAVPAPTATTNCNDDGDDDLPSNPEPVDDPDSEDNLVPPGPGERDEEVGDPEDSDPAYEADDNQNCIIGGVLEESATPSPTPCPSITLVAQGEANCCPDEYQFTGDLFTCICPDSAGGEVNAAGYTCSCEHGAPQDCLCELGGIPTCCSLGYFCGSNVESAPGDADCDGSVSALDAYQTLASLSGVDSGGGCSGGDADCSDSVDAKDTLAILAVVAGLAEAPTC